jgi:hypothetical protein
MFIREIPIFSKYEARVSIISWDSKQVRVRSAVQGFAKPFNI